MGPHRIFVLISAILLTISSVNPAPTCGINDLVISPEEQSCLLGHLVEIITHLVRNQRNSVHLKCFNKQSPCCQDPARDFPYGATKSIVDSTPIEESVMKPEVSDIPLHLKKDKIVPISKPKPGHQPNDETIPEGYISEEQVVPQKSQKSTKNTLKQVPAKLPQPPYTVYPPVDIPRDVLLSPEQFHKEYATFDQTTPEDQDSLESEFIPPPKKPKNPVHSKKDKITPHDSYQSVKKVPKPEAKVPVKEVPVKPLPHEPLGDLPIEEVGNKDPVPVIPVDKDIHNLAIDDTYRNPPADPKIDKPLEEVPLKEEEPVDKGPLSDRKEHDDILKPKEDLKPDYQELIKEIFGEHPMENKPIDEPVATEDIPISKEPLKIVPEEPAVIEDGKSIVEEPSQGEILSPPSAEEKFAEHPLKDDLPEEIIVDNVPTPSSEGQPLPETVDAPKEHDINVDDMISPVTQEATDNVVPEIEESVKDEFDRPNIVEETEPDFSKESKKEIVDETSPMVTEDNSEVAPEERDITSDDNVNSVTEEVNDNVVPEIQDSVKNEYNKPDIVEETEPDFIKDVKPDVVDEKPLLVTGDNSEGSAEGPLPESLIDPEEDVASPENITADSVETEDAIQPSTEETIINKESPLEIPERPKEKIIDEEIPLEVVEEPKEKIAAKDLSSEIEEEPLNEIVNVPENDNLPEVVSTSEETIPENESLSTHTEPSSTTVSSLEVPDELPHLIEEALESPPMPPIKNLVKEEPNSEEKIDISDYSEPNECEAVSKKCVPPQALFIPVIKFEGMPCLSSGELRDFIYKILRNPTNCNRQNVEKC